MSTERDTTRIVRSWLRGDEHDSADRVLNAVLDALDTTPQRRATWWPVRRTPTMNKFVTIGLGAAAVVVVAVVVGAQLFGLPSGGVGSQTTPTPQPSPTATIRPTPTPVPAPPLTQSFTSELHGISMSYPQGWAAQAATEPWTDRTLNRVFLETEQADFLYDTVLDEGHLFLTIASQPIGDAAPEDWVAEQMASYECAATEPIAVDGATGLIGAEGCDLVVVTTDGRGYWIDLFKSGDDPSVVAAYDRAWFEEVLATVQLHPADAVD